MLLGWLSVAHALTLKGTSLGAIHGWTADGALVLEVVVQGVYLMPDAQDGSDNESGRRRYAIVLRGDREVERWLIAKDLPAFVEDAEPVRTAEWAAWRGSHPLTPASTGRRAPGGVQLEARSETQTAEWREAALVAYYDEDQPSLAVGLSNAGEGFWSVYSQPLAYLMFTSSRTTEISAVWSPDGRQVTLFGHEGDSGSMRGPIFGDLEVVASRAAPLTSVLAPPSFPASATEAVVAAVGGLGLVQKGEAKTVRDKTVVYFAPGYEADAKAIAAKVPGGATTAPMDWKGAQHIVVGVGDSAR